MEADAARDGGRLAGMTALVTGAGSGIGQAIARLFAAEGAAILAAGRREEPVTATAAAIRAAGGVAAAAPVDVAEEAAVRALFERLPELLGPRLDVLVNAAGTGSTTTAPDTPLEVWERVFAVNARGTFLMSKHALPLLRATHGAIVNVGSVAGMVGLRNRAAYCASKGAVAAACASTACALARPTRRGSRGWSRSRASPSPPSRRASRSAASPRQTRSPTRRSTWPPRVRRL
jgi:meso-butanediol dehydrogenase/(S,S)-butanediol dehydrogenase/diacetyl reductase